MQIDIDFRFEEIRSLYAEILEVPVSQLLELTSDKYYCVEVDYLYESDKLMWWDKLCTQLGKELIGENEALEISFSTVMLDDYQSRIEECIEDIECWDAGGLSDAVDWVLNLREQGNADWKTYLRNIARAEETSPKLAAAIEAEWITYSHEYEFDGQGLVEGDLELHESEQDFKDSLLMYAQDECPDWLWGYVNEEDLFRDLVQDYAWEDLYNGGVVSRRG